VGTTLGRLRWQIGQVPASLPTAVVRLMMVFVTGIVHLGWQQAHDLSSPPVVGWVGSASGHAGRQAMAAGATAGAELAVAVGKGLT